MDLAEDVLLEILVRLPPKSAFKFKCVSRRWNEIMSSCFFRARYKKLSSGLVGLILSEKRYNGSLPRTRVAAIAAAANNDNDASRNSTTNIPKECGRFINFCSSADGGLALFVYEPSNHPINWGPGRKSKPPPTYHVVNVSTKMWVALPLSPWTKTEECLSTALVCKNTNNFKVVRIIVAVQPTVFVEIYSSRTGMWIKSHASMCSASGHFDYCRSNVLRNHVYKRPFGPPLVLNGIVHWSVSKDAIAIYEPKRINKEWQHWMAFIVDPESDRMVILEKPVVDETLCSSAFTRSSTDGDGGRVWYGGITWQRQVKIWTTKQEIEWGRSPWSLVHTMNFEDSLISNDHSSILTSYQRECIKDYNGFYIIALSPWNPHILLFLIRGTTFLYNTDSGLMELVHYGGPRIIDPIGIHPCFSFSDF